MVIGFIKRFFSRKHLRLLLFSIYLLLIIVLLQTGLIDINIIIGYLKNPLFVFFSIILSFLVLIITVFRWQIICSRHNVQTKFLNFLEMVCISNIAGQLLPGGQISGDLVKGALAGISTKKDTNVVLSAIYIDRFYTVVTLFWLATVLSLFFYDKIWLSTVTALLLKSIYAVTLILTILFILFQLRGLSEKLNSFKLFTGYIKRKFPTTFSNSIKPNFYTALNNSKFYFLDNIRSKRSGFYLIILSIFCYIISALVLVILLSPNDVNFRVMMEVLFSAATTWSVYLVPITPGGIAIGELTFQHMYVCLNPLTSAGSIAANLFFVHRVIVLFSSTTLFLFAYASNRAASKPQ